MAGSNIAIKGAEWILEILVFLGIVMYILQLTGLKNLAKEGGALIRVLEFGATVYGAKWAYTKARAAGFKPPLGRNTSSYMKENEEIAKTLKGSKKTKFVKEMNKDYVDYKKTPAGKKWGKSEAGQEFNANNPGAVTEEAAAVAETAKTAEGIAEIIEEMPKP